MMKESEEFIMERAHKVAEALLDIGAVFFRPNEPFVWASGIKSPIYCDNRLLLTSVKEREQVERYLAELVEEKFPACEVLMGTSTAGIPHAAFVADKLALPMGYVRASSKDHGRNNQIEGRLKKGQKVVVVEDLISTAGSVLEVVKVLREAGAEVLGIVSIFTYGMRKATERLEKEKLCLQSLSNFDVAIEVAIEKNYIEKEDKERLFKFRDKPNDESWIKE